MSDRNTTKNVMLGLIVGLAAGYVSGVLTAPKSGKETRQDIKDASGRALHSAQDSLNKLQAQISVLADQAKARAKTLSSRGKKELDVLVETAKDAQYKAKAVLEAVKNGEAEDPALRRAIEQASEAKKYLAEFLKNN